MKTRYIKPALITVLAIILMLCACGSSGQKPSAADSGSVQTAAEPASPTAAATEPQTTAGTEAAQDKAYEGKYIYICSLFSPAYAQALGNGAPVNESVGSKYVFHAQMDGAYIELKEDGTGFLAWGADNQGPIDSWSVTGGDLNFKAGISDNSGTIKDGFMTVNADDGFDICFLKEGSPAPSLEILTLEDYAALIFDTGEEQSSPEASDRHSQLAGSWQLTGYNNADFSKYYDYVALENQRIQNGVPSGGLDLNPDGTGHIYYPDGEFDVTWTDDTITINGEEITFWFSYPSLGINTGAGESMDFCKTDQGEIYKQFVESSPERTPADPSLYTIGEGGLIYYADSQDYVIGYFPVTNNSDRRLLLEDLYFTALSPDGSELAFQHCTGEATPILEPGATGYFICPPYGGLSPDTPSDAVLRIENAMICCWQGDYQTYEITDFGVDISESSGHYMLYRPYGTIVNHTAEDVPKVRVSVLAFDKDSQLIGYAWVETYPEAENPVNFVNELKANGTATFGTNSAGAYMTYGYPRENVDHYEYTAFSPTDFY